MTQEKRLPVAILSGFLGSGKTTLLQHILTSDEHKLKCAVLINDVAEVNVDAGIVQRHRVDQKAEKVIQLQNGCICCTLREDVLEEVAELVRDGGFDYLIIESTGVAEPMQTAEAFTKEYSDSLLEVIQETEGQERSLEVSDEMKKVLENGGLSALSKIDACITVVDAHTFLEDFNTADMLSGRYGDSVDKDDERNITDLLVDQIEFANVIILNKCDMVSPSVKAEITKIITAMNPSATVIPTSYAKVNLREVLNTGRFSFIEAATGAGWLQSLRNSSIHKLNGKYKLSPKPETAEYGIYTFVYRARRPCHPKRLWDFMTSVFVMQQITMEEEEEEADAMQQDPNEDQNIVTENGADEDDAMDDAMDDADEEEINIPERLEKRKSHPLFSKLFRSKGVFWLATRQNQMGEWSQAGAMLTINGGGEWYCVTPEEDWPSSERGRKAVLADFEGKYGDRRQEIVFIGERINPEEITKVLNETLLTDEEMSRWEAIVNNNKLTEAEQSIALCNEFEDGFEDWD